MIKIRKATLKDVPVLVELWKEFEDEYDEMISKKDPSSKELLKKKPNIKAISRKSFRKTISKTGFVFIAEVDKKAVGYLEGTIKKPAIFINRIGSIWDLFVKEEFRKQGISSMLKDKAMSLFRKKGVKFSEIHVNLYNPEAHSIYKKWGFFDTGTMMLKKL